MDENYFLGWSLDMACTCLEGKTRIGCQESKIWTFFKGLRSFIGPQKPKRKNNQNSIIFGSKIKVRSNFI
jgi:hypothetical protein